MCSTAERRREESGGKTSARAGRDRTNSHKLRSHLPASGSSPLHRRRLFRSCALSILGPHLGTTGADTTLSTPLNCRCLHVPTNTTMAQCCALPASQLHPHHHHKHHLYYFYRIPLLLLTSLYLPLALTLRPFTSSTPRSLLLLGIFKPPLIVFCNNEGATQTISDIGYTPHSNYLISSIKHDQQSSSQPCLDPFRSLRSTTLTLVRCSAQHHTYTQHAARTDHAGDQADQD